MNAGFKAADTAFGSLQATSDRNAQTLEAIVGHLKIEVPDE